MFREVRRKKNEISIEAAKQLLETERRGILAVNGDDGYPYAMPLNYIYCRQEGKIYFHGSRTGHKVDAILKDDKVCFTVYGNERVEEEAWAPYVQSAVVFGRCRLIRDQDTAIELAKNLARKYFPDEAIVNEEAAASGHAVQMFEIEIEHISGKEVHER